MVYTPKSVGNSTVSALHLWEERLFGDELPAIDWDRPVTQEDVHLLLTQYPYIQVINSEASWEETVVPRFIKTSNGWVIHDYGQALSTSAGQYLYGRPAPDETQDTEGEGGYGTITNQAVEAAKALLDLAIEKGWPGIEIVSGVPLMEWALWMAGQIKSYVILGYDPSHRDEKKRELVERLEKSRASVKTTFTPGR